MDILVKTTERTYLFVTYNNEYYLNGRKTTKEEGNSFYLKVKKMATEVIKLTADNKKEIMEYYLKGYDRFVEYIDNYRQYTLTQERNDEIYACAELINKCIKSKNEKEINDLYNKYVW